MFLHTDAFTHTHTFTRKGFHTQRFLHTDIFTHRRFYTQKFLHTESFTHRRFYTQRLLHTNAFTHRDFYTQTLLHTENFTHRSFYTQTLLWESAHLHICSSHPHILSCPLALSCFSISLLKVATLSHEMRFDRQKLRQNCDFQVVRRNV